jgi:hypothetical protein
MKPYSLKVLAAALAIHSSSAFVAHTVECREAVVKLGVFLPSQAFASDKGIEIFEDEDAIRSAYDEWRTKFGKGEFDSTRFENFKKNFKTLTVVNVAARDKAVAEGIQAPGWMYLNEYGDFSYADYESENQLLDLSQVYQDWCNQYDVEPDDQRFEIFSANFVAMEAYSKRTGIQLTLNQNADQTKEEVEVEVDSFGQDNGTGQRKTLIVPKEATEISVEGSLSVRGTQVLQSNGWNMQSTSFGTQPVSGTQVVQQSSNQYGTQPVRGTQVIQSSQQSFQGTQPVRGTQVVQQSSNQYGTQPVRGTRVIQSSQQSFQGTQPVRGTQVIQSQQSFQGTRPVRGTQVVEPNGYRGCQTSNRGTVVVTKAKQSTTHGTRVIGQADQQDPSVVKGTRVIQRSDRQRQVRGTISLGQAMSGETNGVDGENA